MLLQYRTAQNSHPAYRAVLFAFVQYACAVEDTISTCNWCMQGLGFAAQTNDSDTNGTDEHVPSLFEQLVRQKAVDQALFSVWLNPALDQEPAGELSLGHINEARFDGPIT